MIEQGRHEQNAPAEGTKQKTPEWLYWAGLSVYCAAVFLLGLKSIILPLALSFFPVFIFSFVRMSAHRAMVNYLSGNYPELWGQIASEQYANRVWGPRDLIFVKNSCGAPEYLEIRSKQKPEKKA